MTTPVDRRQSQKLPDEDGPDFEHPGLLLMAIVLKEPVSLDDRKFVARALEEALFDGVTLEQALGWPSRRGGVSPTKARALGDRDALICRLWRSTPEWCALAPPAAARLMFASASRYLSASWPRDRYRLDPPASNPNATWWKALHLEVSLPGEKQLKRILAGHSIGCLNVPRAS